MRASFDVLHDPWIPVVRSDGTRDQLGLLRCVAQSHLIREIRDPSPIVEFGLYRLLVGFVLDALILANRQPENADHLKELLQEKALDADFFAAYAAQCGPVFDLFDPSHPFLQCGTVGGSAKPIAAMFPAVPSGTNVGLWHHRHESQASLTSEECARLLCAVAPFMTAGGAGLSPSINGAPPIYFLPVGSSLFETIVANLPTRISNVGGGEPAWRNDRNPGQERITASMAEALTWRPRSLRLIPETGSDGAIVVRQMRFEKGDSTRFEWIDPNVAYRYQKDKTTPIRMREGRPIWRDAGPIVLLRKGSGGNGAERTEVLRPDVVETSFYLLDDDRSVRIRAYGMRTDMKMKVFEWAVGEFQVPSHLGRSSVLGDLVVQELERADKVARLLRQSIQALYPREGAGNKRGFGTVADRVERAFWQRLENKVALLLSTFGDLTDVDASDPDRIQSASSPWREELAKLGRAGFESVASEMDADSDALARQVAARGRLLSRLREVIA